MRKYQMNTWRIWELQELSPGDPEISADSEETAVKQNCSFSALQSQMMEVYAHQRQR